MNQYKKHGFTLVELLVVITIMGMLMSMLLLAVQSARETARRMQCSNNLKQIALAFQNHVSVHGHYPTGGWGWNWVGDPDQGYGKNQPGGWVYNILPYIEQEKLHDIGRGTSYFGSGVTKKELLKQLLITPVSTFHCSSRRIAKLYPMTCDEFVNVDASASSGDYVAKTDYAANAGAPETVGNINGDAPTSFDAEVLNNFEWPSKVDMKGVIFQRSMTTPAEISDGTSYTYAVGEKHMSPFYYENPINQFPGGVSDQAYGDNETAFTGYNNDIARSAYVVPQMDVFNKGISYYFGSPHAAGCNMAFCDGSVHTISYDIVEQVHQFLAIRDDGVPIESEDYYR